MTSFSVHTLFFFRSLIFHKIYVYLHSSYVAERPECPFRFSGGGKLLIIKLLIGAIGLYNAQYD